jgi:Protein of unknown function (DUF3761)
MDRTSLLSVMAAPLLAFALTLPTHGADATAPTTCKDGTTSSATGKGACSGHGGVQKSDQTSTTTAAPAPAAAPASPAHGPTTCKDGTTSSATGKGACSSHGGVQKATTPAAPPAAAAAPASAPAPAPAPAATAAKSTSTATKSAPTAKASNTDPTGATAKCKDGTYSKSQHRSGTCSSHGGVAEWLTAAQ